MFLPILLLLLQCFGLGQAKNASGHLALNEDFRGFEALQNLLDILEDCWPHKAVVVAFPNPLTDAFLTDLAHHIQNGAVVMDMSAVDDFAFVSNLAKERMSTHVMLGDLQQLASTIRDNYHTLMSTSNKITWVLPEDMKEELNLKDIRLDSLQLFFSLKHQSSVSVHEIFGYKGEEISWNMIGSKSKTSDCMCNRIGGKSQRRQKILEGKVLHFASVTPFFRDEEDVFKMPEDVAFYSPSMILRYHLLELAQQTQLILRETNIYEVQSSENKDEVWLNALQLLRQNNSIDVLAESYGHTFERMKMFDFTKSAYIEKSFFISRVQHSNKLHFTNFFTLFSPHLWLAICTTIILIGICLATFDFCLQNINSFSEISLISFTSNLLHWWCSLFLILLQRESFEFSPNIGGELRSSKAKFTRQLLLFITSLLFLIIFSLFASNLTTILITGPTHEPLFRDLTDLLAPDMNVRVIYKFGLSFFKDAKKGSPWHDIYITKLKPSNNSGMLGSAFVAREFLIANEQGVLFHNKPIELLIALKSLEIERHAKHSRTFGIAFPLRKHSDLAQMLDYSIMKLAEAGVVRKFEKQWLPSKMFARNSEQKGKNVSASNVNFQSVAFFFMILATGLISALFLLIGELLHHSFCKSQASNNRVQALELVVNP